MSLYRKEARRTLQLATPIMVGQVSQMLMGLTDSLMIGQLGKVPLAASAFAGSIFGLFFTIGIGLLIPLAIKVSQALGAQDNAEVKLAMQHGSAVALGAGGLCCLVMVLLGWQLRWFGQPPEVLAQVQPYYTLIALSLVPTLMFQALRHFAESLDRPWLPMVMLLAGVILNVGLNWVLIYGNLGMPALGLTGAGWATLTSRVMGVVLIYGWVSRAVTFRDVWPTQWFSGYTMARLGQMLKLGVPISISLSFEAGAFGASAILMGWLGATALAAHQIAITCAALTFMMPLGMAIAVSMRVGRALGAGETERMRPISHGAQIMSAVFMTACAGLFVWAGEELAGAFVKEVEVIALAAKLLVVAAIFQLTDGAQVVAASSLRGLSDVKVPSLITAFAYWGLALPLAYGLGFGLEWGGIGIWTGLAVGLAFAAGALMWRFWWRTRPGVFVAS